MTEFEAQRWIATVGPALLVLVAALGRLGIPTMLSIFLVAAGSLAHTGIIPILPALVFSLMGLTIGDYAAYTLGRRSVARLAEHHDRRDVVGRARALLARYHVLAVFLSRFAILFLTVPVNFLAAACHVRPSRFFAVGAPGNVLFILIFFGLGYLFGGSWNSFWQWALLQPPLAWLALVLGVVVGAIGLVWWQRRNRGSAES